MTKGMNSDGHCHDLMDAVSFNPDFKFSASHSRNPCSCLKGAAPEAMTILKSRLHLEGAQASSRLLRDQSGSPIAVPNMHPPKAFDFTGEVAIVSGAGSRMNGEICLPTPPCQHMKAKSTIQMRSAMVAPPLSYLRAKVPE